MIPVKVVPDYADGDIETLQSTLEKRTTQSALVLRKLLGTVQLQPTQGDIGKPYYRATSTLQPLALLEPSENTNPKWAVRGMTSDGGSNSLRWWRRRESNLHPSPGNFVGLH